MAMQFDNDLLARLTAFQKAVGLSGDGVAGPKTWELLVDQQVLAPEPTGAAKSARPEQAPVHVPAADYPALTRVLSLERTDAAVKAYLMTDFGLDVDQVLAAMDAVLPAGEGATA